MKQLNIYDNVDDTSVSYENGCIRWFHHTMPRFGRKMPFGAYNINPEYQFVILNLPTFEFLVNLHWLIGTVVCEMACTSRTLQNVIIKENSP